MAEVLENIDADVQQEFEQRWKHLLKPIKDLADSWKIDITQELEGYLHDLAQLLNHDISKVDFRKAGILVQISSNIYGKKVESLTKYFGQFRIEVAVQGKEKQKKQTNTADQEEEFEWKPVEIEQAPGKINMKESDPFELALLRKALFLPRPPALLLAKAIPRDAWLSQDVFALSGESLGKMGDFMINSATIHQSGALLTDRVEQALLDQMFMSKLAIVEPTRIEPDNFDIGGFDFDENVGDVSIHMWHDDHQEAPPVQDVVMEDSPQEEEEVFKANDPWAPLDPHDPNQSIHKPFRRGKIQVPRIPEPEEKKEQSTVLQFLNRLHAEQSVKSTLPKNPIKSIVWDEFDTVFIQEQRRRQEVRRKQREKEEPQPGGAWTVLPPVSWNINPEEIDQEDVEGFDDAPVGGMVAMDDGGMDDFGAFEPEPWIPDEAPRNDLDILPWPTQDEPIVQNNYDDLARQFIDSYLLTAQKFEMERETTMAKRVRAWEDHLRPVLESLKNDPDMNAMRDAILFQFESRELDVGDQVEFKDVVRGMNPHHVAAFFVGILLMVDVKMLKIIPNQIMDGTSDAFSIQLLSKKRHDLAHTMIPGK